MTLTNLFWSFDGRIGRGQWWFGLFLVVLTTFVIGLIGGIVDAILGHSDSDSFGPGRWTALLATAVLAVVPWVAVCVKRFHDRGRTGWWLLASLVPASLLGVSLALLGDRLPQTLVLTASLLLFAILVWLTVSLGVLQGSPGSNRYGPPPP